MKLWVVIGLNIYNDETEGTVIGLFRSEKSSKAKAQEIKYQYTHVIEAPVYLDEIQE